MYEIISFFDDKKYIDDFIKFPRKIYPRGKCPTSRKQERELLEGKHLLSKYFQVVGYLVYVDGRVVARCLLTLYQELEAGYLGFFEAIEDYRAVEALFAKVEEDCVRNKRTRLVGPVNASFWIGYRFKLDNFNEVFTNEPYNLSYYPRLFLENGFNICNKYQTNKIKVIPKEFINDKYIKIKEKMLKAGYVIESPRASEFYDAMKTIYGMLIVLYKDFPIFHKITEDEFLHLYENLRYIVRYDMIRIVYREGEPKGFHICLPNYGFHALGDVGMKDLPFILKTKRRPKEYVHLYLGALDTGAGVMLIQDIAEKLQEQEVMSIGALIQEGKVSNKYYSEFYYEQLNYGLYEKIVGVRNKE